MWAVFGTFFVFLELEYTLQGCGVTYHGTKLGPMIIPVKLCLVSSQFCVLPQDTFTLCKYSNITPRISSPESLLVESSKPSFVKHQVCYTFTTVT